MRDAHRSLDGERRGGRGRATFLPHEQKQVSCGPKKKTSEKSPPGFQLDFFANKKFPWLAFLAIAMILRLVQKRFLPACETKKDGILLVFKRGNWRFFFSLVNTSKTLCRLHLIVLVDLIMFTHIKQQRICKSHCHMLPSRSGTFYFHRSNV